MQGPILPEIALGVWCLSLESLRILALSVLLMYLCLPLLLQVQVAPSSRNSVWAAFNGRNRREIKQGDRSGARSPYLDLAIQHQSYMP